MAADRTRLTKIALSVHRFRINAESVHGRSDLERVRGD
jgi:hypothetical protein